MSAAQDTKKKQQPPPEEHDEDNEDAGSEDEQNQEQSESESESEPEPEPEPVKQKKKSKKQQPPPKQKKSRKPQPEFESDDEGDDPVGSLVQGAPDKVGKTADTVGNAAGAVAGKGEDGGDKPLKLRLDLNIEAEVTLKAKIHGDVTLSLL